MQNVNWWLMVLSFLLGLVLTLFLLIRRVKREVPVYASPGAGAATGVAAAGAAGVAGAAKLKGGAGVLEDEPYGAGSVRVKGTATAPDGGYTVKGNEDSMLYHTTDSPSWKQTIAEIWFRNVKDAERAGFAHWDSGGGAAKIAGAAAAGAVGGVAAAKLTGGADDEAAATAKMPKIDADADDAATSRFAASDVDADAPAAKTGGIAAGTAAAAAAAGGAATAKFAASGGVEEPYGAGSARVAAGAAAPSGYDIKGNEDSMLYHTVDSPSYKQTIAEVWFRDEPSAEAAGFTHWSKGRAKPGGAAKFAEVPPGPHGPGSAKPAADGSGPEGWTVKGNEDSMLYHSPESSAYNVTVAEVWFRDVPTAEAAGFNRWDSGKSQRGKG